MSVLNTVITVVISAVLGGIITWCVNRRQLGRLIRMLKDAIFNREHVSLNEEFVMTQMLAENIRKADFDPDFIFAIYPGGAMVAEWLSRRFLGSYRDPKPMFTICVGTQRFSGGIKSEKAVVQENLPLDLSKLSPDAKVLLVNDVSRGGDTLKEAYVYLAKYFKDENIRSATLTVHKDSKAKPSFSATEETEKVIRFDWKHKQG